MISTPLGITPGLNVKLSEFPYRDTLKPIKDLERDYPYASNLLCAVILERCIRDYICKIGVNKKLKFGRKTCMGRSPGLLEDSIQDKKVTLGDIRNWLKKNEPRVNPDNLDSLVNLRNDYIHSRKRSGYKSQRPEQRTLQYKNDNKQFRCLLAWVLKNRYFWSWSADGE